MSLFGKNEKRKIEDLEEQIRIKDAEIQRLKERHEEKDEYFLEVISDGMRHGSSLSAKHMAERKKYLNGE